MFVLEHMSMHSYNRGMTSEMTRTLESEHLHDPAALAALATQLLAGRVIESVADVFKLLGDPTRVRLLDALSHGERCVCDLATLVGSSESAISHQLRLLRSYRLVRVRRVGRMAYYSLDDHHVIGLLHDACKHVQETQA
jgi:ArsR family transcriptional regulator